MSLALHPKYSLLLLVLLAACGEAAARDQPAVAAAADSPVAESVPEPTGRVTRERWESAASAYAVAGTYVAPYDSTQPTTMRVTLPGETTQADAQRVADIGRSHLGVDATVLVETPSGKVKARAPR